MSTFSNSVIETSLLDMSPQGLLEGSFYSYLRFVFTIRTIMRWVVIDAVQISKYLKSGLLLNSHAGASNLKSLCQLVSLNELAIGVI